MWRRTRTLRDTPRFNIADISCRESWPRCSTRCCCVSHTPLTGLTYTHIQDIISLSLWPPPFFSLVPLFRISLSLSHIFIDSFLYSLINLSSVTTLSWSGSLSLLQWALNHALSFFLSLQQPCLYWPSGSHLISLSLSLIQYLISCVPSFRISLFLSLSLYLDSLSFVHYYLFRLWSFFI